MKIKTSFVCAVLIVAQCLVSRALVATAVITDYDVSYRDAVMDICFQDPISLFGGSDVVDKGWMSLDAFLGENRKNMEAILEDPLKVKKVMIDSGAVVGFVEFFKFKEQSVESVKKQMQEKGVQLSDQQIKNLMPHLKDTDAQCGFFCKIECLAVSNECRRCGYGRALLRNALEYAKTEWPMVTRVELDVNTNNKGARALYESEGFVYSAVQTMEGMQVTQYEKSL